MLCDGKAMLIDGGNVADSSLMYTDLKNLGVTHLDYVEYLQAMECAEIHGDVVRNYSDRPLWFEINGEICEVAPEKG